MRLRLTVLYLLVFAAMPLLAQTRLFGLSAMEYSLALDKLILLQDPDGIVPLSGGLDSLDLRYHLPADYAMGDRVVQQVRKYLPAEPVDQDSGGHVLIMVIDSSTAQSALAGFGSWPSSKPGVALISDRFQPDTALLAAAAAWSLIRYPDSLPELGIQLLFGGLGTQNRLRNDWGSFSAGSGIDVPGPSRLGYAPPYWVGLDRDLLADSLGSIMEEGIRAQAFPGAQVMVVRRGKVVYQQAFGYHTYDSLKPVQIDHLYDLASLSKVTTALPALMKMNGEGRFDLDAPLKAYIDGFGCSNKRKLSFRKMLAHQARLRPWIPYWRGTLRGNPRYPWRKRWDDERINDWQFKNNSFQTDSSDRFPIYVADSLWLHRDYRKVMFKSIRKSPLLEEESYRYSGLLFYLLPQMVADLTGTDYELYLKKNFYHPLGATTLTYNPLRFFPESIIVPTERDTFFRMQLLHGHVHDEGAAMMGGISANAGLFGNSNDLAKLFQMYLNRGLYGGQYFIAGEAVDEFTSYQYREKGNRRGLGFDKPPLEYTWGESYIAPSSSPASFGHSGYTGTFAWADPEEELIFIFLSNRVFPTRDNRKLYTLNLRPRMHEAVYRAIQD